MQIKKAAPKKLLPPSNDVKLVIETIAKCPESDIPKYISHHSDWKFPRGDLFHWVKVLDRFDTLLENHCKKYGLNKGLQKEDFQQCDKEQLVSLLSFSRLLLENCTNRNIYNSLEHLNHLLNSTDMEILLLNLHLILRPAQKHQSQRSYRATLSSMNDRLITLAQRWTPYGEGLSFSNLVSDPIETPSEVRTFRFSFYTPPKKIDKTVPSSVTMSNTLEDGVNNINCESKPDGITNIEIHDFQSQESTIPQLLHTIIAKYNIPDEQHFTLLQKLRIAKSFSSISLRRKMVTVRLFSLAILALILQDHLIETRLLQYEPTIISKLVELLHPEKHTPHEIQTAAFYALDSLSRLRSKTSEVLAAISASANHGIIIYFLRKLSSSAPVFPGELVEAFFSFLTYIVTSQVGCNMVISAGIVPVILSIIDHRDESKLRITSKVVTVLDNLIYSFNTTFTSFCNANGLSILIKRIKDEYHKIIDNSISANNQMELDSSDATRTLQDSAFHERNTLLKVLLKFTLHMMQTSGTADRLRNLVESSLPHSINLILKSYRNFTNNVVGLAMNIMTTLIHNEPTSLSILQELKLPTVFLDLVKQTIPLSIDVISAIPNAFGAICLNSQGLDQFCDLNPIPKFLSIFYDPNYLKILQDGEISTIVGTAFDELIRHHPSLKAKVMEAIVEILNKIISYGSTGIDSVYDDHRFMLEKDIDRLAHVEPAEDKPVVIMIDSISKFLEAMLQHPSHCKDFLDYQGLHIFLKFLSISQLPYNFSSTSAAYTMSHVFRSLSEAQNTNVIIELLKSTSFHLKRNISLFQSSDIHRLVTSSNLSNQEFNRANELFKNLIALHGHLSLLAEYYSTPTYSHGKNIIHVLQTLSTPENEEIISMIVRLFRFTVLENILLKNSIPSDQRNESSLHNLHSDAANTFKPHQIHNAKHFKYLLSQIPTRSASMLQGIVKSLSPRRAMQLAQKKLAFKVATCLSKSLVGNLDWGTQSFNLQLHHMTDFSISMMGLLPALLLEERNQNFVHLIFAISFTREGGLDTIISLSRKLWELTLSTLAKEEMKDQFRKTSNALEISLNLCNILGSSRLIMESPQLANLTAKDKTNNSLESFDPHFHIVQNRSKILILIHDIWASEDLKKLPPYVIRAVLQNLTQILKSAHEQPPKMEEMSPFRPTSSSYVQSSRASTPSENRVLQLIEMGFRREAARIALVRSGNNISAAADYLLEHPEVVAGVEFAASSSTDQMTTSNHTTSEDPQDSISLISNPNTTVENQMSTERVDGANNSRSDSQPMELSDSSSSKASTADNKGKQKADETSEYENLKTKIQSSVLSKGLILLDTTEDIIFDFKELLLLQFENIAEKIVDLVDECLNRRKEVSITETQTSINNRLRLLALFLNDAETMVITYGYCSRILQNLITSMHEEISIKEQLDSLWLASCLLVLEGIVSINDEPRRISLNNLDEDTPTTEENPSLLSSQLKVQILNDLTFILNNCEKVDQNVINANLRLLMRLTRDPTCCSEFTRSTNLNSLIRTMKERTQLFEGQKALIMLILRHTVESDDVLFNLMQQKIFSFFSNSRPRALEISTFVRNHNSCALRDPPTFVRATQSLCELTKFQPNIRSYQIGLNTNQRENSESLSPPTMDWSITDPSCLEHSSQAQSNSIQVTPFLISQILSLRDTVDLGKAKNSDSKEKAKLSEESLDSKKEKNSIILFRCFLLFCLAELLLSYPLCQIQAIQYGRRKLKDPGLKPKAHFLNYLLTELLPSKSLEKSDSPDSYLSLQSTMTSAVLISLCSSTDLHSKTNLEHLLSVKRTVIESICKAIKETLTNTKILDLKYSKLLSLIELCIKLLIPSKSHDSTVNRIRIEENSDTIAKMMLERNVVSLLTQALIEVDLNYPSISKLVTSLLRCLDLLSRANVKFAQKIDSLENDEQEGEISSNHSTEDETPDLYRNSALGMFEGHTIEDYIEEENDMDSEDDEDSEIFEDEFEQINSDASDQSEMEHEMEIVIERDYHGSSDVDVDEEVSGEASESEDNHSTADHTNNSSWSYEEDLNIIDHSDEGLDYEQQELTMEDDDISDLSSDENGEIDDEDDDEDNDMEIEDYENEIDDSRDRFPWPSVAILMNNNSGDHRSNRPSRAFFTLRPHRLISNRGVVQMRPDALEFRVGNAEGSNLLFEDTDFPSLSRVTNRPSPSTESSVHPLLINQSSHSSSRNTLLSDFQRFEDLIGSSVIQQLEQHITRTSRFLRRSGLRIDLGGEPIRGLALTRFLPPFTSNQDTSSADVPSEPEVFTCYNTFDRWSQECRFLYGNSISDKASRVANHVINSLKISLSQNENIREIASNINTSSQNDPTAIPIQPNPTDNNDHQGSPNQSSTSTDDHNNDINIDEMTTNTAENNENHPETPDIDPNAVTPTSSQTSNRVTVSIHDQEVDITNSGIDPTFLEALPEELRQEVLNEHLQSRNQPPSFDMAAIADAEISDEFLEALPPDIREEVLEQQRFERRRRAQPNASSESVGDLDPATFLASLDSIRRDRPPAEEDDWTSLSREEPRDTLFNARNFASMLREFSSSGTPRLTSRKKSKLSSDNVPQLIDKASLCVLIRILFLPQPIAKHTLFKIISSICESPKTASDMISILLCIVNEAPGDLSEVDKLLSSINNKSTKSGPKGSQKKPSLPNLIPYVSDERIPHAIVERSLDCILFIVSGNESITNFFLSDQDNLGFFQRRDKTKKGKSKEKLITPKCPFAILLSFLDRTEFLRNSLILEPLIHLLSTLSRQLHHIMKKRNTKEDHTKNPPLDESTRSTSFESSIKPSNLSFPAIPDQCIRSVINILTNGECSSKAFQYTLSLIQHLCALPGAKDIITSELVSNAKTLGTNIYLDLECLNQILSKVNKDDEIPGSALAKFSPASSQQAKLLRLLKTIDYLHEESEKPLSFPFSETLENEKTTTMDVDTSSNTLKLLQIYSSLNFRGLWIRLSQCLQFIIDKSDELIHVATVLLPLVEAFMVMSKQAIVKVYRAHSQTTNLSSHETDDSSKSDDEFFFHFTEENRKILNIMVRNNPTLMSGSFFLLVHNPKVLEFDNKRNYFNQQLHKRSAREHFGTIQLNVRRQYVFEDSFHQLQNRSGEEIKYGKLSVKFYEEEGVDAGGVTREWFQVLSLQMFNPDYALFRTSAVDKVTYQPNRASWVNPDHLLFFKFVGRIIGKAIYDGRLLDCYFTRSFYKHILGKKVDYRDVEAIDPEYYKSLVWILENDITDVIDLNFSIEVDDFGKTKVIELIPNGQNISVTEENKQDYVRLVAEQKLYLAIEEQIKNFLIGFRDIIPSELIQIFNEQELELLISGLPDIDIDDWKNNTEYQGYSHSSPQIQWFWRAVRSFDQEERAKLLQFVTGTSKVPLEGFSSLQGSSGVQKFQIHKDFGSTNRLPSAHTCFNQLDIPLYESYDHLRKNLLIAIQECSTGFGFG